MPMCVLGVVCGFVTSDTYQNQMISFTGAAGAEADACSTTNLGSWVVAAPPVSALEASNPVQPVLGEPGGESVRSEFRRTANLVTPDPLMAARPEALSDQSLYALVEIELSVLDVEKAVLPRFE